MASPGRKSKPITVRTVGEYSDGALEAFARLLLARDQTRPTLSLVATQPKKPKLSRP